MPHAGGGGGSHGGGFHSSSSSGVRNTPRVDSYGRTHSQHYVRPGFYYHNTYVPYSRVGRVRNSIGGHIVSIIVSIIVFIVGISAYKDSSSYSDSNLENYALDKYAEIYNQTSKDYECNILVTIVCYDDLEQFDYISIVGDDINFAVDNMFGNQNTVFGGSVASIVPSKNYYDNLYSYLSECVEAATLNVSRKYYTENSTSSYVVNESHLGDISGINDLKNAEEDFYEASGYRISFLITDSSKAYQPNVMILVVTFLIGGVIALVSIIKIITTIKVVNFITQEEKNGNGGKYFEGEVNYETHQANHPIDQAYNYDPNEFTFNPFKDDKK